MSIKGVLSFTFEYETYAKADPGFVELQIHFGFNPSTSETGRYGSPENYDPGSGFEVWMIHVEIEVECNGKKMWQILTPGEWLRGQCENYLHSRDESDLIESLPNGGERDPDDERDEPDEDAIAEEEAAQERADNSQFGVGS